MNDTLKPVVIITAADKKYLMPLTCMLKSLSANAKKRSSYELHILYSGFSKRNQKKSEAYVGDPRFRFNWIKMANANFFGLPLSSKTHYMSPGRLFWMSLAAYYRIRIPEILPPHTDKAIYLDADIIVEADISDLWDLEMADKHVLAVPNIEPNGKYFVCKEFFGSKANPGLPPDRMTFSSGVLVMSLALWRHDAISQQIDDYIRSNRDTMRFWDQDGFNAVLAWKWEAIDARWNQQYNVHQIEWTPECVYSRDYLSELKHRPYIIHYTCYPKPWLAHCNHPLRDRYFWYLDMTPRSGWRPKKPNVWIAKIQSKMIKYHKILWKFYRRRQ